MGSLTVPIILNNPRLGNDDVTALIADGTSTSTSIKKTKTLVELS